MLAYTPRKVFGRGQEDTEELHLKRKLTALALFKEQSEWSILRRSQGGLRREVCVSFSFADVSMADNQNEDGGKTGTTKEHGGANREHETPAKKTNVRTSDKDLADDVSSMSNVNAREDDSSSVNDDKGIADVTISRPAKRNAETDVLEPGEPPAKRARPQPSKRISPTSLSTADADAASPQTTSRDHVEEMYANSE